ncbi:MAG: cyclic nucleotide-binding domain-containing protein, partial [Rhodothermales bacterium]|nr:cyclic nucleotide-binding domain-containing protein [Rhodothermales bacterium]
MDRAHLINLYPFLTRGEPPLIDRVLDVGAIHSLTAGTHVMFEGNRCVSLPLMVSGVVRVYKLDESGREITLYRIEPGESGVLTAACILGDIGFPANALVEADSEV